MRTRAHASRPASIALCLLGLGGFGAGCGEGGTGGAELQSTYGCEFDEECGVGESCFQGSCIQDFTSEPGPSVDGGPPRQGTNPDPAPIEDDDARMAEPSDPDAGGPGFDLGNPPDAGPLDAGWIEPPPPACVGAPQARELSAAAEVDMANAQMAAGQLVSLGSDEAVHLCPNEDLYLQAPSSTGNVVHVFATWEADADLDLTYWGPASDDDGIPLAQAATSGFEVGTVTVGGSAGSHEVALALHDVSTGQHASMAIAEEGTDSLVQVRTGKACQTDDDCTGGVPCLMPHWNPTGGLGTPERWRIFQQGACAPSPTPLCTGADADQPGNDRRDSAHQGSPFGGQAKSCQFDEDWYRFGGHPDGHLRVTLRNLDVQPATYTVVAYDEDGNILGAKGYEQLGQDDPGSTWDDPDPLEMDYMWSGVDVFVRVFKLDEGDGHYALDFTSQPATCTSSADCSGSPSASWFERTSCSQFSTACAPNDPPVTCGADGTGSAGCSELSVPLD